MATRVNISTLLHYYEVTWRKDSTEILQPTFFVMLKPQVFLPSQLDHNLSRDPEASNYYGYILSRNHKSSDGYVKLGTDEDVRVAAVQYGRVTVANYDSRLLMRITPSDNAVAMKILLHFVADHPISDPKPQALVRLRSHTQLEFHGIKLSGPLIIMSVNSETRKVTVAGFSHNTIITEMEVDGDLLCGYREPKESKESKESK